MPRFTKGDTEIETSNQVEIVRLRASGYKPVADKKSESDDSGASINPPGGGDSTTGGAESDPTGGEPATSSDSEPQQPKGRRSRP